MMVLWMLSCAQPECSRPQYKRAECRVQAENELARLVTADGVDVRFQDANSEGAESWSPTGRLEQRRDGVIAARVATLGDFRLTFTTDVPVTVTVEVDNVHPLVEPLDGEQTQTGLVRTVQLDLGVGDTELVGRLPEGTCDAGYRVAVGGDIQTNPLHFRRIVADLHEEAAVGQQDGVPLLGLIILGDVSDLALEAELTTVLETLSTSPVPAAIVPGNHDVYASRDALFNRIVGPGNYAFTLCGSRYVMLDTGNGHLADSIQGRLPELIGEGHERLFAAVHHPPHPGQTSAGWTDEAQAQQFLAELAARDADLVLAGHVHQRMQIEESVVPEIIVGSLGADQYAVDPDYGYLRLQVDDEVSTCFVSVPTPGSPGVERGPPENCPAR